MAGSYNNNYIITNRGSQQLSNTPLEPSLSLLYDTHQASAAKAGFYNFLAIFGSSGAPSQQKHTTTPILLKQHPFPVLWSLQSTVKPTLLHYECLVPIGVTGRAGLRRMGAADAAKSKQWSHSTNKNRDRKLQWV
jgi:hypothetical protein